MSDFASEFEALFRAAYLKGARRIRDKRERLPPETVALLDHLAAAGPMTIGEMARHIDRAASTVSEMVDHLAGKGLLTRDRDPMDGRRSLIWLTEAGQGALIAARNVLDHDRLMAAAAHLSEAERGELLRLFGSLTSHLKGTPHES